MYHQALSDRTLATQEIAPISSVANVDGAGVDMAGWDGVEFRILIGAMGSGATVDGRVTQSANSNFSGETNITGAALAQVVNTANANLFIIDIWRPTNRYVRFRGVPGTANSLIAVTATRYRRTGLLPPTQSALQQVKVVVN